MLENSRFSSTQSRVSRRCGAANRTPPMLRLVRACKPKTLFDGDDDEVESPDARASPASRRAPPSALADVARTLEALQETNDWPSRALPRAAPPQPDAGAADASPPRARLPLRRTTAEERFAMLSSFHEDPHSFTRSRSALLFSGGSSAARAPDAHAATITCTRPCWTGSTAGARRPEGGGGRCLAAQREAQRPVH